LTAWLIPYTKINQVSREGEQAVDINTKVMK